MLSVKKIYVLAALLLAIVHADDTAPRHLRNAHGGGSGGGSGGPAADSDGGGKAGGKDECGSSSLSFGFGGAEGTRCEDRTGGLKTPEVALAAVNNPAQIPVSGASLDIAPAKIQPAPGLSVVVPGPAPSPVPATGARPASVPAPTATPAPGPAAAPALAPVANRPNQSI